MKRRHFWLKPQANSRNRFSNKDFKESQTLFDQYWSRLLKEFVPELNRRTKWQQANAELKENDIVWIYRNFTPRRIWPISSKHIWIEMEWQEASTSRPVLAWCNIPQWDCVKYLKMTMIRLLRWPRRVNEYSFNHVKLMNKTHWIFWSSIFEFLMSIILLFSDKFIC